MRRREREGAPGVQLGLIVTPMLDMSFQILAFFIATYQPPLMERHIPGSLVPPENPAVKSNQPNNLPNVEIPPSVKEEDLLPQLQEAILIKAMADRDGNLRQLFLKTALETEPQKVTEPDDAPDKAVAQLEKSLAEMIKKGSSKADLKLAADGELKQQYVMMVYSAAKRAGYVNIHFVPPPVLSTKLKGS